MKNKHWVLKLGTGLALSVVIQVSHSASLMEIYNLAVSNDPQFLAAKANLAAAQEALPQSTAAFLPTLRAGAYTNQIDNSDKTLDSNSNGYTITLTQPIYRHGSFVQRRSAKSSVAQAESDFSSADQNLTLAVAKSYFGALSAQDGLDFAEAEKRANARQLDQTKQRFDVGLVAITDVHESRAAHDFSVAEAIAARNDLDSARESLREITGSYHEQLDSLDEDIPLLPPQPASMEVWTELALEKNTVLNAAHEATKQARELVKAQQSNHYPTLDLTISHGNNTTTLTNPAPTVIDDTTDSDNTTASLNLDLALYEGGRTNANTRQARELLKASRQSLEQTRRATQRQIRNAYRGVLSGISRVRALKQARVSSQSALRAAEAGYEVGTRTTVDVLVARKNLFAAQRDYAQARYNYLIDKLSLYQAAGTLNADHLNEITQWMH
ncbi:MAG: TolC family outer membrane protein [Gammaproteobacteria bacterium]|nr:TolC family outer membrane protein [Gammaproteobacteria bacterium]